MQSQETHARSEQLEALRQAIAGLSLRETALLCVAAGMRLAEHAGGEPLDATRGLSCVTEFRPDDPADRRIRVTSRLERGAGFGSEPARDVPIFAVEVVGRGRSASS